MKSRPPATKPFFLHADFSLAELKTLSIESLQILAEEIRAEIIKVVSTNGGHLASSLGAVELILALHYVYDSPLDQFVFDVGHQAYAHKILTGRYKDFRSLRLAGGLSGFPRREESPHDSFNTGHSSTSISAALGLACARDLEKSFRAVVAVIGDGALTGGMALEALNHAGGTQKNVLVILNDNRMSISPNVGAISQYLSLKFTSPEHILLREKVKTTLQRIMPQRGGRLIRRLQTAEEALKTFLVSHRTFLAAWGFKYLGPIDGHNLGNLVEALRQIKSLKRPVFLHVLTTKGKGYLPAEQNPLKFHGLGKTSSLATTKLTPLPKIEPTSPTSEVRLNFTEVFGNFMVEEASKNPLLVGITAAMSQGTGLTEFFKRFPQRAFDVGIAEQHAVTFAGGLAAGGLRPVVAIYSTFLQRAFDQLYHDIALQKLPVLFAVDRAGLVGEDGITHHGYLDLSYLRLFPNFTVMAPKDELEFRRMLSFGLSSNGPVAIRYPRGQGNRPEKILLPASQLDNLPLEVGRGELLLPGDDLTILALGQMVWPAYEAALKLKDEGIDVGVINLRFIKPLDRELLVKEVLKTRKVLTIEENSLIGGLKSAVCETLVDQKIPFRLAALGIKDPPPGHAPQKRQRDDSSLNVNGILKMARELHQEGKPE
ncbi:MAG: 1-deoxy-D-xylulose-5-phosphate synthase [Deltaproteobacteria bacterium]|jgi:1-deoxy-D-xylulose-5-phosphate synthase|nr:1-deoxy-D-xylulose-5-phosphate synthase [Deltaproteobacteria bacterium]